MADGAATVAMVISFSCERTDVPLGSVMDERWMESPTSLPVRSTMIDSGMELAGQVRSRVW
jgi:hypothetical protein